MHAEFVALVRAPEDAAIDYALCGELALAVHGAPRATKDIDVIARKADAERLRDLARAQGFTFEALPMQFTSSGIEVQRYTKLIDGRPLMLDILWLIPKLEAVWTDRQRMPWQDGTISVVSRDGLITLQSTAGRPHDLVDIQSLAAAEAGVTSSENEGRAVAARLQLALDSYELVPAREPVDMSREAVTDRLADALAMSTLCLALGPRATAP